MTKSAIINTIWDDYYRVFGKVIFPHEVDGYLGDDSVVIPALGLHPFEVTATHFSLVERYGGDGWWDPCWNIRPLFPDEFQQHVRECVPKCELLLESMWVYGHSYREDSDEMYRAKLRFNVEFIS